VDCGPLEWRGQRFSSGCGGKLSLRQALAISSNTAALRLARQAGLEAVAQKAHDLGISSPLNPVPGLALGQSEVTLLELTGAYGAIAEDGVWHAPSTIRKLTDAEACPRSPKGSCRSAHQPGSSPPAALRSTSTIGRRVTSPASAKAMRSLLQSVVSSGTGTAAYVGGGAGGKTGTTNDGRDLWFIGFLPQRRWVMGVWLGNDNNAPTQASSALAASLWGDIVRSSSPAP
jgi:membrane peptidoglycan carboxypeptidase